MWALWHVNTFFKLVPNTVLHELVVILINVCNVKVYVNFN